MRKTILDKLKEIEEKENVSIIYAVESGSRAWGFASDDSDYDVRFIYIRKNKDYLSLEPKRDVIEWQLDEVLDINGWDLQKALKLLHSSNPTLFEWAYSPMIYRTTKEWDLVKEKIAHYFSIRATLWHYLNTAKNNYTDFLKTDNVKVKKYFYVIRPILACQWILKNQTPPPVLFSQLMDTWEGNPIKDMVVEMLMIKMAKPEQTLIKRNDELNRYIEEQLVNIQDKISLLPKQEAIDWKELNKLFIELVVE